MNARDEVLGRVRSALSDRPSPPPVRRDYRTAGSGTRSQGELVELFADRVADYRATVHRDNSAGEVLQRRGVREVVVPLGLDADVLAGLDAAGVAAVREPDLATLDRVSAVVTTCRLAIAVTGTIVLDHGEGTGPRLLTLVPDHHVVVVRRDDVVADVPEAVAALDPTRPMTWISGPSATSDIELQRVEGVHGPRVLDVVIV